MLISFFVAKFRYKLIVGMMTVHEPEIIQQLFNNVGICD